MKPLHTTTPNTADSATEKPTSPEPNALLKQRSSILRASFCSAGGTNHYAYSADWTRPTIGVLVSSITHRVPAAGIARTIYQDLVQKFTLSMLPVVGDYIRTALALCWLGALLSGTRVWMATLAPFNDEIESTRCCGGKLGDSKAKCLLLMLGGFDR